MEFKELIERARQIRAKYAKVEMEVCGRPWGALEMAQGFVTDVGDLMKIVSAKSGLRKMEDVDKKLTHELSDCLWSIIVIADALGIDLESEFMKQMDELEKRVDHA